MARLPVDPVIGHTLEAGKNVEVWQATGNSRPRQEYGRAVRPESARHCPRNSSTCGNVSDRSCHDNSRCNAQWKTDN